MRDFWAQLCCCPALRESPRPFWEASLPKKNSVFLGLGSRARRPSLKKAPLETCHSRAQSLACRSRVRRNDRGRLRVARLFVVTRYTPMCTIKRSWECQPTAKRTHLERPPNDAAGPRVQPETAFFHRSRHGRDGRGRQGARDGAVSASRCVEALSRHRRASSPGDEVVGGFFFNFEAVRRCSRASSAQARRRY